MAIIYGDYLSNPYGRGTGVMPVSVIRQTVETETATTYPVPIRLKFYATHDKHLVVHVKLPSRTKADVFYDVVIDCDLSQDFESRRGIARYPARVFSNSPSFYFTFAKAFEEHDFFCRWLKKKYDRKVLKKDPQKRNPSKVVGYERTVYTAMWVTVQQTRSRTARDLYDNAEAKSYRDIAATIQTQDEVEEAYEKAPYTAREQSRRDEIAQRKAIREAARAQRDSQRKENQKSSTPSTQVPTSKSTQKTGKTGKTSKSGFVSRIKRIGRK